MFERMRPHPPGSAITAALAFAGRTDRDNMAQASALSVLLKMTSGSTGVVAAVQEFLARPLTTQAKEAVLNGIANSHTKDQRLVQMLATALDDPDEGVKFTAAQGSQRLPKEATLQAQPSLQRLAADTSQPTEVRAAAKSALQKVR